MRGLAWTGVAKFATQFVRWGATLAIARLLTPSDYGLVGMAMVYVGLVQLINEFGLTSAIVQNRELTSNHISRLGGLAILATIGLWVISTVAAVPIAAFFDEQAIRSLVTTLSAKLVIDALGMVPRALLMRDMRFDRLAWIEGAEAITMALVTLGAALVLRSYWALVAGILGSSFIGLMLALASRPWRPAWPRDFASLRQSVVFGRDVVGSTLAWYAYSSADLVIVGRLFDKAAVGAYSMAWNTASVPVEKVATLVSRVAPSVFAAVQRDPTALRRYFVGLLEALALITFPMSVGLVLVAHDFVPAVLGPQWDAAIGPLRWLALFAGVKSLFALPQIVLVATGHARQARNFSFVAALVVPVCLLAGSRWGMNGVAAAWLLALPICVGPLDFRYCMRLVDLRARTLVRALWPPVTGSVVMAVVVLAAALALPSGLPHLARLVLLAVVGAVTYGAYIALAHGDRVRAFRDILRTARQRAVAPVTPDGLSPQAL